MSSLLLTFFLSDTKVNGKLKDEPYGNKIIEDLIVQTIFLGRKGGSSLAATHAHEFGDEAQAFNPISLAALALAATAVMCLIFAGIDRR